MKNNNSAFTIHKSNGIYLKFPNGNAISTIWTIGSYTEHHDDDNWSDFDKRMEEGSNTAEIMVNTSNEKLHKKIHAHFKNGSDDSVIGWVSITDWLWVLNQLAKEMKP